MTSLQVIGIEAIRNEDKHVPCIIRKIPCQVRYGEDSHTEHNQQMWGKTWYSYSSVINITPKPNDFLPLMILPEVFTCWNTILNKIFMLRAVQCIFITISWRETRIFCCSSNWGARISLLMNFLVFHFASWLLLMHNLKIYANLPFMCKLDCIAEMIQKPNKMSDYSTHIFHYIQINKFYQSL